VLTRVNGTTVQDGTTDQMVYTVGDPIALMPTSANWAVFEER